jgi:hypothetical protein
LPAIVALMLLAGVACGGEDAASEPTSTTAPATATTTVAPPTPTLVPPTATTAATPTALPEAEPMTFNGDGNAVTEPFDLTAGLLIIQSAVDGDPVQIWLSQLEPTSNLTRAVRSAADDGAYAHPIGEAGSYRLDVRGSGAWEVSLLQPDVATGPRLPLPLQAEGDGDALLFFIDAPAGNHGIGASHRGDGAFTVNALDETGDNAILLINTSGASEIDAELRLDTSRLLVISVKASGPWSLSIANPEP